MRHLFLTSLFFVSILLLTGMIMSSCENHKKSYSLQPAKVYVANEEEGSITVIDLQDNKTTAIDLSNTGGIKYKPHNVQVAPDGKSVWASAVPVDTAEQEQLIAIDPATGTIIKRISVGKNIGLVHVVFDNESKNAFVTASSGNQVIQVDATTYNVVRSFPLGHQNTPHGMRYSKGKLYVANMGSKSISVINVADGKVTEILLGGMVVQVAVTRDNKFIFASLYDTKEVAQYDLQSGHITRITLPAGAQGPIQLYATPDSKLLYVADQGELMERPVSNKVFVIDIATAKVISTITVGKKAHGIVISNDGKTAYVTNSNENTVSIIDVATQKVTGTILVGKGPNGIGFWFETGGMP